MYILVFVGFIKNLKEISGNHQKKGNRVFFSSRFYNHTRNNSTYNQLLLKKKKKEVNIKLYYSNLLLLFYELTFSQEFTRLNECANDNG